MYVQANEFGLSVGPAKKFYMIHDGKHVTGLLFSSIPITSSLKMFVADTMEECKQEIENLKLKKLIP